MRVAPEARWEQQMWDTVVDTESLLSHDLPCLRCGHAAHRYLACDVSCECAPAAMPGARAASVRAAGAP